jgi:hypothetical protein
MTAVAPSRAKTAPVAPRDGISIVRPLAWFALALIGEIARLQLIAAGHLVGYQHSVPVRP